MSGNLVSLITPTTTLKVSSTLDKSVGKKHIIDDSPETCWTSLEGLPQYIQLSFDTPVIPKRALLTFQGGFVGTHCSVYTSLDLTNKKTWSLLKAIYPEDVNRKQSFDLHPPISGNINEGVTSIKLVFETSSDFFGRITVYDLKLEGTVPA
ncbi:galactose-binding domain-like protein [Collybia nuda]|uniref:Galactose-binding domain-like protein n=1 Tax=Collybia nuda TaxID=64659 RepID=A0A9P5YJ21_9AGAR|nr:galactose-binding domain-like protein [Collybia nuda]